MSANDKPLPGQLAIPTTGVRDVPGREGKDDHDRLVDKRRLPYVTMLESQLSAAGWPEKIDDGKPKRAGMVYRGPIEFLLTHAFNCDAHATQYVAPGVTVETAHGPRLADELRLASGAESRIPGGYTMILFIVDSDGPLHDHKAEIKSARKAGALDKVAELGARTPSVMIEHEEWWKKERAKIERLLSDHFIVAYRTSGGYRIVGSLEHPMKIASPAEREAWARQYLIWLAHLRLTYGIEGDPACAYAECLFRLPRVMRDDVRQNPEFVGDPTGELGWCLGDVDDDAALAEARRLWPSRMDHSSTRRSSGGDEAEYDLDAEELLARWEAFDGDEQQRRIDLYVDDLQNRLEPSTDDNSGQATRLIAARSGVIGFGIGDLELVMDLMLEHWVPLCDQSWTRGDLVHKVQDAAKNSTQKEIDFNLPEVIERRNAEMFAGIVPPQTSPPTSIAPVIALPTPSAAPTSKIERLRAMLDPPKPKLTLDEARAKIASAIRNAGKV